MHKQPEITLQTRNAFISVFCELYKQKNIARISVKEITSTAGYNRCTFYQYFKDIYEIEIFLEDELLNYISESIAKNSCENANLEHFITHFIHMLSEKQKDAELLLGNAYNHHFQSRLKQEVQPLFLQIFQISRENVKAQYALEFYIQGIVSILSKWFRHPHELSKEDLAKLIHGILQEGVSSQII